MVQTALQERKQWLSPIQALTRLSLAETINSDTLPPAAHTQLRYGFRIGGAGLLIREGVSSEALDRVSIYTIPNTPHWLKGLIDLRGNLVPLFDLKDLLELTGETREKPMILILDEADQAVGIFIDGWPRTPDLSRKLRRLPPLPAILRDFATAAYIDDGMAWLEFDHQGFFQALAARIATQQAL